MIHENIELTGSFVVSGSFVLPNHPISSSVNALTGSIYHDTTDNVVKVYTGNAWSIIGTQTASSAPSLPDPNVEYLVVAGGGGSSYDGGGGAGAGGLLSSSIDDVVSGSVMTVTVGAGGAAYANGIDSTLVSTSGTSFSTVTSIGGGNGSGAGSSYVAGNGGSGGGGAGGQYNDPGGTGTAGQGNNGGNSGTSGGGATYPGSGGGGAGAVGGAGVNSGGSGKPGGIGLQSKITGTATYYAGGGGGAASGTGGAGGLGGGGAGGSSAIGTVGTANTGGGAGGSNITSGITGGSGVVILAYPSASLNAGGGIVGDAGNGRKYHQFNESGTLSIGAANDFQIITESLSAHFDAAHFSSRGSSTWTDLKGNGNGSISGATLNTHFYTFDGSNDVVNISGEKITSDNMSIEVWLTIDNPSESGTYREIISQQANSNRGIYFGKTSTANQLRFGGKSYNFSSINASTFTHLVVTRSSTGDVIFYENGSQGGTASGHTFSSSQGIYNGTGTRIGRQYGNYTEYWDGNIAQVRFYNKILSAAQVLQNYNATKINFI